jgi:hypothetical protein
MLNKIIPIFTVNDCCINYLDEMFEFVDELN